MKALRIFILFMGIAFISCESDDEIETQRFGAGGDIWVQFASEALSIPENSTEALEVSVLLAADSNPNGVTVSIDIETDAPTGAFTLSPGTEIVIPAGELSASFFIQPVDNDEVDGDSELEITLSSSDAPVGLGGGPAFSTVDVLITDDDCPPVYSSSYDVAVTSSSAGAAPGHFVNLEPVPGTTNEFTVTSTWGPDFVAFATGDPSFEGRFLYSARIVVNDDFSVTVIGDDTWADGGTGTYTTCTDTFEFTLEQSLFTTAFTVDIVMTGR